MPQYESLGFVETLGLVPAIECADAMAKAARVSIKTIANADAALLSVICEGDLAACVAAVDAGKAAAARVGKVLTANIIARPFGDTGDMVESRVGSAFKKPAPAQPAQPAKGKKQ